VTMQTVQWRSALRTGDQAYCRGAIVTLVERVTPDNWRVTGGALPGVWGAQAHELQPVPGKSYAANEGRDPRLCYPDGKPVRVGDLVRVMVTGHKAGDELCEVETVYGFGLIGLKQRTATRTSTYTLTGSLLKFMGRKSEGELPDDDGHQPLPDVDADLEPAMDETFARSRADRAPARHPMLDVFDEIDAQVTAEEAAEAQHVEAAEAAPVVVATEPPAREEEVTARVPMVSVRPVALDLIRRDGETQPRQYIDADTVREYADAMTDGAEFPPIVVYKDVGGSYWLADGFHRYYAALEIGLHDLMAEVRLGELDAARWFSYTANGKHGLRRSRADLQRAIDRALLHPTGAGMSNSAIARHIGCSDNTVRARREQLEFTSQIAKSAERTGADGRTINVANIGKKAEPVNGTGEIAAEMGAQLVASGYRYDPETNSYLPTPESMANAERVRALDTDTGELIDVIDPVTAEVTQVAVTAREVLHSSDSNEWYTPARYLKAAREAMGGIDLDPASCEAANRNVEAAQFYTAADDGLAQEWHGRVWCNPPYGGETARWVAKLIEEFEAGRVPQAILLVNAATDREWFQRLWDFPVCFTHHRIRFLNPDGVAQDSPTNGSAFVFLAADDDWNQDFAEQFRQFGPVVMETVR
jgi:phage N-6-adenine-methyltransferase